MPYFESHDSQIWFEMDGSGPPLLLIAGLASDIASWTPVRAALATQFTLIMPDNRGAGRTRAKSGLAGLSIEAMAGDIVELADHLDLNDCLAIGHSMGAAIAAGAACRRPARIRKLVLAAAAAPNGRADAAVRSLAELHARFHGGPEFYRALFPWLFTPAFLADQGMLEAAVAASVAYPHSPTTEMFTAQVEAVLRHRAPAAPRQPTLILAGALDILFTPEDCRAAAATSPSARYEEIPGAAHSLFWDQPAAAIEKILKFAAA